MGVFLQASMVLRTVGAEANSLEEVATGVVRYLCEQFVDKDLGGSALPLARLYVTVPADELDPDAQDFARAAAPDAFVDRNPVCLALLGTVGEESSWQDRRASRDHKTIPLPSVEAVRRSPMIARLIAQLGVDVQQLIEPDPGLRDFAARPYNVFYVPEARDSP